MAAARWLSATKLRLLFIAHEQLAESAEPAMAHLDHPAPGLLGGIAVLDIDLFAPVNDVGNVPMLVDDLQVLGAVVASVSAQMLVWANGRALALDDDGREHGIESLAVIHVGCGHDERQRDANDRRPADAAFCSPFFPRSVGLGPTASCANGAFISAPSTLCHRQAIPCMSSYSARPAFHNDSKKPAFLPFEKALVDRAGAAEAFGGQRLPLAVRAQHVHDGFRRLDVPVWAAAQLQACERTACRVIALAAARVAPHVARTGPSLPMTQLAWPSASLLRRDELRLGSIFYLFTDKL